MPYWNRYYNGILERLYPTADINIIIEALDNKFGWKAIQLQACRLGVARLGRGGPMGGSKYKDKAYCSKCREWFPKKNHPQMVKDYRCPNPGCNNTVRMPSVKSYRRQRGGKKNGKK